MLDTFEVESLWKDSWELEKSHLCFCLYKAPPPQNSRVEAWRCRGLVYLGPSGLVLVGLLLEWNGSGTRKTHWRLTRGKRFPARILCEWWAEMYPAGCRNAWRGKILDANKGRASPWPGQCSDCRRMGHRRATGGEDHVRLASRTLLVCGPGCLAALAVAAGLLLFNCV